MYLSETEIKGLNAKSRYELCMIYELVYLTV